MRVSQVKDWLDKLPMDAHVAIDEGGLTLITVDDGRPGKAYLEVGGAPEDELGDDPESEGDYA